LASPVPVANITGNLSPALRFPALPALWLCPSSNQIKARWRAAGDAWQGRLMALGVFIIIIIPEAAQDVFDGSGGLFSAPARPARWRAA
jgi:hypothetical protein